MTRIVAVRHGETDWNRRERMQGWAPVPLNETGRKQARAAGAWLADEYDFDRVVSSDLLRTEQTTELLLEAIGDRPVSFDPALRERNLGVYQGLPYSDVEDRFPTFGLGETAYRATDAVPEGGESFREVADRVTGRFEDLAAADDGTVLVVTHGGPLCILLGHAKGHALTDALCSHRPDNCSVTEFRIEGDVTVHRENATGWDVEASG
jgi:probable phosphoglycerate mutase